MIEPLKKWRGENKILSQHAPTWEKISGYNMYIYIYMYIALSKPLHFGVRLAAYPIWSPSSTPNAQRRLHRDHDHQDRYRWSSKTAHVTAAGRPDHWRNPSWPWFWLWGCRPFWLQTSITSFSRSIIHFWSTRRRSWSTCIQPWKAGRTLLHPMGHLQEDFIWHCTLPATASTWHYRHALCSCSSYWRSSGRWTSSHPSSCWWHSCRIGRAAYPFGSGNSLSCAFLGIARATGFQQESNTSVSSSTSISNSPPCRTPWLLWAPWR